MSEGSECQNALVELGVGKLALFDGPVPRAIVEPGCPGLALYPLRCCISTEGSTVYYGLSQPHPRDYSLVDFQVPMPGYISFRLEL
jgi:hypothetical protein